MLQSSFPRGRVDTQAAEPLASSRNDKILQTAWGSSTKLDHEENNIKKALPKAQCFPHPYSSDHGRRERKKKSTWFLELQLFLTVSFFLTERKTERLFCSWLCNKPSIKPWIKWELKAEWCGRFENQATHGHPWPSWSRGTSAWRKKLLFSQK